jgi:DivIVA domain-containing protein
MLTPEEIQAREFLVSLRGYDRDEVHSFLEQVARYVRDLQSQLEGLHAGQPSPQPPETAPDPVQSSLSAADPKPFFEDLGQTTQRIVEAAYESAAEIQRRARDKGDHELAEARNQATKLVTEGQRRREVIEGLVAMLEERRAVLIEDLRGVVRMIEQVLTDFAAQEEVLSSEELLAVAQITAPDEHWVPEQDGLAEAELATAAEEPDSAPSAQPAAARQAEATELAEEHRKGTSSPNDGKPADRKGATSQASKKTRLA